MKHGRHGGILAPGIDGKVVKPDGTLVGYDEEGELCIRTPAAAIGYLDNEEAYVPSMLIQIMLLNDILELARPSLTPGKLVFYFLETSHNSITVGYGLVIWLKSTGMKK